MSSVESVSDRVAEIKAARDQKLAIVLRDKLPAWIVSDQVSVIQNSCIFEVVFNDGREWVQRRYDYDAEVDVLHFAGQTRFDEAGLPALPDDQAFHLPV